MTGSGDGNALQKAEPALRRAVTPRRFAAKRERTGSLDQCAPTGRKFRLAIQLVRQNEEEQVGATIARQALELCGTPKPVLQGGRLPHDAAVAAMLDAAEIDRIEFQEKGVAGAQSRIVHAQMFFEHRASLVHGGKAFPRGGTAAVVPAQIGPHLFAFEDCRYAGFVPAGSVAGDVRAIAALRETYLDSAGGITLGLRPQNRQALEPAMRVSLAAPRS